MKKIVVGLAAALATAAFWATPALADQPADLQCAEPAGSIKFNVGSGSEVVDGVTITWSGTTVSVSGGSATLCVKAGNGNSGSVTLNDGQSFTVNWDLNPQGIPPGISHIVVYSTTQNTTTGGTTGETTGETTGQTTGETTGETTGDTDTTGGTTGTTGGTTGSGVSGSTTGGTTGGTAATPTGGNLPFTGLPVWVPLLAAAAMFASGIFLVRRRKGEVS